MTVYGGAGAEGDALRHAQTGRRPCPLWVISGHDGANLQCLLPPKADIVQQGGNVCFVAKADSCTAAIDLIAKPCVANCIREHAGAVLSCRLYGLRQPLHVKGRFTSNRRLRLALNEPAQRRQTALFFGRDPV
jgi:hypothetical protein